MSKQVAVSSAFSILMMAAYVLFGADAAHEPLARAPAVASTVQISALALPQPSSLVPALR
jgi:hypothetical protein